MEGSPVKYRIPNIIGAGTIPPDRRIKIIYKLEELGAFKVHRNERGQRIGTNDLFYLLIDQERFREVYGDFSIKAQDGSSGNTSGLKPKVSIQILISDLEAKYQDIMGEKVINKFYLKLSDYGKCLNENEMASPILSELYTDSQRQIAELKNHWVEFFKVWRKHAENLVKKANEVGIKDVGPLQDELEKLKSYLSQPNPQFNDTELPNYWQPYREVILRFGKAGMTDKVEGEHLDEDGNLKLYPEYRKIEVAWDKYKQAREVSVWWAHYQISRLAAAVIGSEEEKGHYFKDDNFVDQIYKYEFDKITLRVADMLIYLKRERFEEWIKRLHTFVIPRLGELPRSGITDLGERYQDLLKEIKNLVEPKSETLEKRYEKLLAEFRTNNTFPDLMIGATSPSVSRRGLELGNEFELKKIKTEPYKLPNKRDMAKEVTRLSKICDLGPKEKELLKILSNFEPKRTKELTSDIPTKDYKHLKGALTKKIKGEGWIIKSDKGKGLNPDSFYTLARTTPVNN